MKVRWKVVGKSEKGKSKRKNSGGREQEDDSRGRRMDMGREKRGVEKAGDQ